MGEINGSFFPLCRERSLVVMTAKSRTAKQPKEGRAGMEVE